MGNKGLRAGALEWAGRIAKHSGAVLHSESSAARTERGGEGRSTRIPFVVGPALEVTRPFKHPILAGAKALSLFLPTRETKSASPRNAGFISWVWAGA
ncbi:MAG: hypothetical protein Ct9H90mP9_5680 [Pseudomonadota bacterium]|nr:MAG: hypothetical protein Ct9H90mP9_5680 [Pseudomonadota bacterium]